MTVDREIGTIHAAQIAAAALFRSDYVRRMVALGIESRGERKHLSRAELHAEATGLAALNHDGNRASRHHNPTQPGGFPLPDQI